MYTIKINNMKFYGFNGCLPEEKVLGQPLEIDIAMQLQAKTIDLKDNINNTVNYALVYEKIQQIINTNKVNLIETLAYRIITELKIKFPLIAKIHIKIRKYSVPIAGILDNIEIELHD